MGRPLSKQQLFNANAKNNIKVQFHNGTASVKGYIVEQTGSKRFKCKDANGVTAICYLKDKASADLQAGEMSITFKYDGSTVQQAKKITRHRISVIYDGILRSFPWSFSTSNTDGRWQVEEAGTNAALAGNTDLEGDEINGDYPVPGSGTYKSAATALSGLSYAAVGTPYAPGGLLNSVPTPTAGLRRAKYNGNFCATSSTAPASWVYNFFGTAQFIKAIDDTSVSWGQQLDGAGLGESQFSCEWLGYVQAPKSGNFNIYAESDDHCAVWIGSAATATPSNATRSLASANKTLPGSGLITGETVNSNTVTLVAGKWYPIRMWHSEFSGGCKAQFYMQAADGTKYNGTDLTFAYNTTTEGF